MVTFRGTKNWLNDIPTDLAILTGELKHTQRYRDSKKTYEKAKEKYHTDNITLAGHSMGGSLANAIGKSKDDIYTLNKGVGFLNPSTKSNEHSYRTSTDLISALSATDKHQHNFSGFNANFLHAHQIERLGEIKPIYLLLYSIYLKRDGISKKFKLFFKQTFSSTGKSRNIEIS